MSIRFSVEYFPPKTEEGIERLAAAHARFSALKPDYCSVTYGAGGSTRDRTLRTIQALQGSVPIAPHLSCIGDSRTSLLELLQIYRNMGIHRIVALRGDLPSGQVALGELPYARDLVALIQEFDATQFEIAVAAYPEVHPQAESAERDLRHFIAKIEAGAQEAITQYFYNPDAYWSFCDRLKALGCHVPIIPGIMPITQVSNLLRFSDACGAEIPRWLRKRLADFSDDPIAIRQFGAEVVTRLCEQLLQQGAPSLHFYSMNQLEATLTILQGLGRA